MTTVNNSVVSQWNITKNFTAKKNIMIFFSVIALNFVMQIKMTLGSLRDFRSRGLIGYLITILCNSRTESGQIKGSTFL